MGLQHGEARGCSGASTPWPCSCSERGHVSEAAPRGSGQGSAARRAGTPPGISPARSLPAPGERQSCVPGAPVPALAAWANGKWVGGDKSKQAGSRKAQDKPFLPQHLRVIKGPPKLPEVLFPLQPTCKVGLFFSTGLKPASIQDQFRKGAFGEKAVLTCWGWPNKLETRVCPAGTAPAPAAGR